MSQQEAVVQIRTLRQQAVADVERFLALCEQKYAELNIFDNRPLKLFWNQARQLTKQDLSRRYRIIKQHGKK